VSVPRPNDDGKKAADRVWTLDRPLAMKAI
jgi:hypothetical protein